MDQIFGVTILSIVLLASCNRPVNEVLSEQKLINVGEQGVLTSELIYALEDRPTPSCHASTLVEIPNGILAAWFGGKHEKNPDVGIWVSSKTKGQWSVPQEVATGVQSDGTRYPCWNPVLFQPVDGPLILFYKVGPSPSEWWGMMKTSEDHGQSWSGEQRLGEGRLGPIMGPIKNKPIQLANGSIICPTSIETEKNDDDFWQVHFETTSDLGKTWEVIGPINDGVTFDAIQPSILTYRDGRMQILCRTRQNVLSQSWSTDQGQSWSEMTATDLPNPSAGTDAVTLSDGRQLLVYNHTVRKSPFPSGRNMLNVAISTDGVKWKPILLLERSKGEYSYPAVIQSSDGLIHISYTYHRETIKYVVVDPKLL